MGIPVYHRGEWTTGPDPTEDTPSGDYHQLMNEAGFTDVTRFHAGGDGRALSLTVWQEGWDASAPDRKSTVQGIPGFILDIDFPDKTESVGAKDIVDLMDLLAQWTPMVQVAMMCDDSAEKKEQGR